VLNISRRRHPAGCDVTFPALSGDTATCRRLAKPRRSRVNQWEGGIPRWVREWQCVCWRPGPTLRLSPGEAGGRGDGQERRNCKRVLRAAESGSEEGRGRECRAHAAPETEFDGPRSNRRPPFDRQTIDKYQTFHRRRK